MLGYAKKPLTQPTCYLFDRCKRCKFMRILAQCAFFPWIILAIALRLQEACIQLGPPLYSIDDALFDAGQTDALYPRCNALQVMRRLAIQLHERTAVLQHLDFAGDLAQEIGDAYFDTAVTADMYLITGVHAHHAKVFDGRLGTVARTTGNRNLEFVRRPGTPGHLLNLDAQPGGILCAETAPLRTDASLHRAQ